MDAVALQPAANIPTGNFQVSKMKSIPNDFNFCMAFFVIVTLCGQPIVAQSKSEESTPIKKGAEVNSGLNSAKKESDKQEEKATVAEIQKAIAELNLKEAEDVSGAKTVARPDNKPNSSSATLDPEYSSDPGDRLKELQDRVAKMKKLALDRQGRAELARLKKELNAFQYIHGQLEKTRLPKAEKKEPVGNLDTFVVAKVEVKPRSTIADITFASMPGLVANRDDLVDYLKSTPEGHFRDYRIISRHKQADSAESALGAIREDYDNRLAQHKQMLEYIKARNAALARLSSMRRC